MNGFLLSKGLVLLSLGVFWIDKQEKKLAFKNMGNISYKNKEDI